MMKGHPRFLLAVLLAAVLLGFSQFAAARAIDINLNNDTAQFRYIVYDGRAGAFGKREMDIGFLFTTEDDYLGMFGAQVIAEAGSDSPGLDAGIGFKIFAVHADPSADIFALTLGGQLRYSLPPHQRIQIGAEGYYAPDVVTFADGENFGYFSATLGYEILPRASVYIGYRDIRTELEQGGTITIDDGGFIGMKFEF